MSAIMNGIVDCTIGLVLNKIRDNTAQRLSKGDIVDSELRQIVVRDLDDIKTKIDGLSAKDLKSSLSFFIEGVTWLHISLETSDESRDKPSSSQAHTEDDEPEGATAMTVQRVEGDAIDIAFQFHQSIAKLRIAPDQRYQSAITSFKEANRLATDAFNNIALDTEDRVMASKLRIASKILACLDDPKAAVQISLMYLTQLHDLQQVQKIFTVWKKPDSIRARRKQTERNEMVKSILAITESLLNLILQYTKLRMDCLSWPTINTGQEIYHPILHNEEIMNKLDEEHCKTRQIPWILKFSIGITHHVCAITSKGKILLRTCEEDSLEIKTSDGSSFFAPVFSENDGYTLKTICRFVVDENDTVYVVVSSCNKNKENDSKQYKLLIIDKNGSKIAERDLKMIKEKSCLDDMALTKDGKIVIYCSIMRSMYIYDMSANNMRYHILPLPFHNVRPNSIPSITVSDQNEIIYLFPNTNEGISMHIITMDGTLKHEVHVPANTDSVGSMNVVFNHVDKKILVSLYDFTGRYISLFSFSTTGALDYKFKIPGWYDDHVLISHPKGLIAIVSGFKVMMLQM